MCLHRVGQSLCLVCHIDSYDVCKETKENIPGLLSKEFDLAYSCTYYTKGKPGEISSKRRRFPLV